MAEAVKTSAAPDIPHHASSRRIKELEVMVADVVTETDDTTTLVLFTGNDALDYRPGHFLTIDPHQFEALDRWVRYLEDLKARKEPPRAYSLASSPHEKYLAITVKEERYVTGQTTFPPLLSPILVKRTQRGTKMAVTGFTGSYVLPPDIEKQTDHLVHICAGSGIVPNWSMIKFALSTGLKLRHTLIYSNKTWDDIIFRDALQALEREHSGKLTVVHTLTRETPSARLGPNVRKGRVTLDLLREFLPDPSAASVYTCGPAISVFDKQVAKEKGAAPAPRFLETVLDHLAQLGVKKDRIRRESYG